MDKHWQKHYPAGMPHEINPDEYSSLVDLFESTCQRFSSKPAFSCMGKTISFTELEVLTRKLASYFQNTLKLEQGDRIAIMSPNLLQYPVVLFAALRAGLIVVNVNPLYTAPELKHQLCDSDAKAIVIVANFADVLEKIIDQTNVKHVLLTEIGDMLGPIKSWLVNFVVKKIKKMVPDFNLPTAIPFSLALKQGDENNFNPVAIKNTDTAFLQYTGGTTGVAKGVILTHRNIVANTEQVHANLVPLKPEDDEVAITALPLYHIFCLTANCFCFFSRGSVNVLITNPRDLPTFIKELTQWRPTFFTGVNTLYNALVHEPGLEKVDFSNLRLCVGGGMAVQKAVAEQWKKVTGCHITEAYGLTESSPLITVNPVDIDHYNGSIGIPAPNTDVVFKDEAGQTVPTGELGELWAKGPQITPGYWNRPEATAEVITDDQWLKTGDMGYVDDAGFMYLVDRKKDMVIVSGFNVYPNEIEDTLTQHPAILEAACIGIPSEKSGEVVKAFIVFEHGQSATDEELSTFLKQSLTAYKIPKSYEVRDELPKTNVGKILRRALRE